MVMTREEIIAERSKEILGIEIGKVLAAIPR
jgi:hypothetical protein